MDELLERYRPHLLALARAMSCNFVDIRTTTKEVVRAVALHHAESPADNARDAGFLLSTCLRYEVYRCDGAGRHEHSFFYASGLTCMRRFLSVVAGLQSEIVGEREIFLQVSGAIRTARRAGRLPDAVATGIEALLALGSAIRARSGVNSDENYSTVAADLLVAHLAGGPGATVAIIGGGYMAEAFFTALLRARFDNVRKILWINRSVPKLRRSLAAIIDLLDVPIELLDLVEGNSALVEANAVFCALAASPDRYADVRCRRGTFIVDVSYPPVFTPNPEISLVNIANTYFDHLVRTPVPKTFVAEAESEIDRIIAFLRVSS